MPRKKRTDEDAAEEAVRVGKVELADLDVSPGFKNQIMQGLSDELGVPVRDVPVAARLLHGKLVADALNEIPLMDAQDPRPFIASVAALVGQGVLSPDKAKVMLYACQLQVAVTRGLQQAEPAARPAPRTLAASASTGDLWAVNATNGFDPEGRG